MRNVLRKIDAKTDFKEFSENEMHLAKDCYDAKLFEGVVLEQMASGRIIAEYRHEPRLTLKGVQFIQAEEDRKLQAKKLEEERAKDEAERKKNRKYQLITALISGLGGSLLTLFFQNISQIFRFLSQLLNQ